MPQEVPPYKYEEEKNDTGMTALVRRRRMYLDLAGGDCVEGLRGGWPEIIQGILSRDDKPEPTK